jgi:hypothetical protein
MHLKYGHNCSGRVGLAPILSTTRSLKVNSLKFMMEGQDQITAIRLDLFNKHSLL